MHGSRLQFTDNLNDAVSRAWDLKRPLLTHLNADTSWVLSLPYPAYRVCPEGRILFNILIDPWLQGSQSDVASWFSRQWHAIESSVQTIAELDACLEHVETSVQNLHTPRFRSPSETTGTRQQSGTSSHIDLVLVSHEFTDHCNVETLRQIPVDTPVLATKKAANLIQSYKHFDTVYPIICFSKLNHDWRSTSSEAMPPWLGISRITTDRDALYFHSAILITFNIGPHSEDRLREVIVYTPHGINADDLKMLAMASPQISTLALLHGLHDVKLSVRQLNLGAHNALRAQRISGSKYWISTRK